MEPRLLSQFLPSQPVSEPDEILDLFLAWASARRLELYPAQEEALLELMADRHVILNTPTGSGKTLVSQGLQFKALCEGRTCFYTSPIKALASEKFFDLCDEFGADRVGMQTGDASINPEAPLICCTAEVLSNRALRQGETLAADYVVMDEFHYYGDPDRGVAWQVPLITLPKTRFLLMSATLGNTAPIAERIEAFTGTPVSLVYSEDRPVPLDYEYRETPLHETVVELLESGKAPIYVVSFTQRECAERAQALTSANITTREERQKIRDTIGDFHFDTPYGKEIRRFLGFGVAVHHAGLLPKYRLLVEQLAQKGLLRVICGTDTLGVGVNIPIRTVLFSQLSKFDGQKVTLLKVRDFKQISGRAGRKGFDDRGSVVCQAPEHVIRSRRRAGSGKKKNKKSVSKPAPGTVSWNRETFQSLMTRPPETLQSRFRVSHGMIVNLLQRDAELNLPGRDNFASLREILDRCHETPGRKRHLLRQAAMLVRSMHRSNVLTLERDKDSGYLWVVVNEDLQWDFSLFQALALYMVEAIAVLDAEAESYPLDVMSLVEAILENPRAVLYRQVHKLKGDLIGKLKAQGMPYEERMEKLDEVSWEKPNREFLERTFNEFRKVHPWVRGEDLRPKSIAREIYENYHSFKDYVRRYGMQRLEGTLLRYISQFYKTLSQSVPERAKTEEVYDIIGYFRTMLDHTDTSLLEEWESLLHPELLLDREKRAEARRELRVYELFHDPRAFKARVRAELHQLVRCLSEADWEEAAAAVLQEGEGSAIEPWTPERLEVAMEPFFEEHERVVFDHQARLSQNTRIEQTAPRLWAVSQVLIDPEGDNTWALEGIVDLRQETDFEDPLIRLRRIGR